MILNKLKNNRGSALIGAITLMVSLAFVSTSLVSMTGTDTLASINDLQSSQALGVGNGGLQLALKKLDNGQSPDITNKLFARGNFTIKSNPSLSLIEVISTVGNATKKQSMNADFAKNCVDLIVSDANLDHDTLKNVKLIKRCNKKVIFSKISVAWTWSNCLIRKDIDDISVTWRNCTKVDGNTSLKEIEFEDETIFETRKITDAYVSDMRSDKYINLIDKVIETNDDHPLEFSFSKKFPNQAWFKVTAAFADGSELTKIFRVRQLSKVKVAYDK